jgi:hypothetical protein
MSDPNQVLRDMIFFYEFVKKRKKRKKRHQRKAEELSRERS